MSKTPNDHLLFELIHSLTKSEKRSFKLFAKRSGATNESKFIKLFDAMEKRESYDEAAIMKKLPGVSKTQFANLKSHLYSQVLASLRLSNLKDDVDIDLREQLDYIRVLYKKGLYTQSLRLLNRAKKVTGDYRKDLFQLALLDYEKQIRSQQVFDLEEAYTETLDKETDLAMMRFNRVQKFFTLATRMKARFVERGMVKNDGEMNNLKALFYRHLPEYEEADLAFNEKFYLYRACYWFAYLTYDFQGCVTYARKWIEIFQETGLDKKRRAGYLKGLNRLLQSAFRVDDVKAFHNHFELLTKFEEEEGTTLASNTEVLLTKYKTIQSFNRVFLLADFEKQQASIESLLADIKASKHLIDLHNLMVIYYKAGVFYFAIEDYEKSRYYLTKVIDDKGKLRSDLKGFARIIDILIDYDTGDEEHLERKIKSTFVFIENQENLGSFQEAFLEFLGKLGTIYPQDLRKGFIDLKNQLEALQKGTYTKKLQLYFDLLSWLEAKIERKRFIEVVKEKAAAQI